MNKTSDFIKSRIQWKAKKFDISPDATFYFADLSADLQENLKQVASIENAGNPVLYFKNTDTKWTLVCDKAVIGFNNEKIYSIIYGNIQKILPKIMDDVTIGQRVDVRQTLKSELNELVVTAIDGTKFTFYTKTGQDHFALHNILLMLKQIL